MEEGTHLTLIAFPPAVPRRRARAFVGNHGRVAGDLPPVARAGDAGAELVGDCVFTRGAAHPFEERRPDLFGLFVVQTLTHHRNLQGVVWRDGDLLTPVRGEEIARIEIE